MATEVELVYPLEIEVEEGNEEVEVEAT